MKDEWRAADFVGGHPALDFLNTVADTGKSRHMNKLLDWPTTRRWAVHAELLTAADIRRFEKSGPVDGAAALADLIDLRETAYRALSARTGRGAPDRGAMTSLTAHIQAALGCAALEPEGAGFRWRPDPASPHRWKDALALAFEDLLRGDDFARVRQCGRCTWFFIDRGRGAGRRWCDMRTCGNRAKAEAFRASQGE